MRRWRLRSRHLEHIGARVRTWAARVAAASWGLVEVRTPRLGLRLVLLLRGLFCFIALPVRWAYLGPIFGWIPGRRGFAQLRQFAS